MSININFQPAVTKACAFWALVANVFKRIRDKVRANRRLCWILKLSAKYFLCALVLVVWTLAACRYGQKQALEVYRGWFEEYKAEQEAAEAAAIESDPYTIQLNEEAELLAKVLYGVKDNKSDDLRTYCWCVFNRVDSKQYPDNLKDVIAQPQQWMRYDPSNPVLENLYQIAREELDKWHKDSRRPVSSEYVFMNWSSNDICLRDVFAEGSGTHYWRYNQ